MEITQYTRFDTDEILPLYEAVGWSRYTRDPAMLAAALAGSLTVLCAREDGHLVGLARAVGDGASILYIQDILVLPECQGRGVGRALLEAMLARFPQVGQTVLITDDTPETAAFYTACGLAPAARYRCAAFVRFLPLP